MRRPSPNSPPAPPGHRVTHNPVGRPAPPWPAPALFLCCCFSLACTGPELTQGGEQQQPSIEHLVTGPAAEALVATGRFETVHTPTPGGLPEISEAEARRHATAWIRDHGQPWKRFLEEGHGAPVDVEALEPCERPYYAASPFEPLPREVPLPTHRAYGPYWLVTLCGAAGGPQARLAVSAYNTDILDEAGRYKHVHHGGGEYSVSPIPKDEAARRFATPEDAVRMVAEVTGRAIRRAPELVRGLEGPGWSHWRIVTDGSAQARRAKNGTVVETDEFFVGLVYDPESLAFTRTHPAVAVLSADQPDEISFTYISEFRPGVPADQAIIESQGTARRRVDMPLRVDITEKQPLGSGQR